jgi:hypothetical protein
MTSSLPIRPRLPRVNDIQGSFRAGHGGIDGRSRSTVDGFGRLPSVTPSRLSRAFFSFVGGVRTSPHDGPGVAALPQYARISE